jgi:hypothetical protein
MSEIVKVVATITMLFYSQQSFFGRKIFLRMLSIFFTRFMNLERLYSTTKLGETIRVHTIYKSDCLGLLSTFDVSYSCPINSTSK